MCWIYSRAGLGFIQKDDKRSQNSVGKSRNDLSVFLELTNSKKCAGTHAVRNSLIGLRLKMGLTLFDKTINNWPILKK